MLFNRDVQFFTLSVAAQYRYGLSFHRLVAVLHIILYNVISAFCSFQKFSSGYDGYGHDLL